MKLSFVQANIQYEDLKQLTESHWLVCFFFFIVLVLRFVTETLSAQQINFRHIKTCDGFKCTNSWEKYASIFQLMH